MCEICKILTTEKNIGQSPYVTTISGERVHKFERTWKAIWEGLDRKILCDYIIISKKKF